MMWIWVRLKFAVNEGQAGEIYPVDSFAIFSPVGAFRVRSIH
jgi:hypothetical protein